MTDCYIASDKLDKSLINSQLVSLIRLVPQLVYIVDLQNQEVVFVSKGISKVLGYDLPELLGRTNPFEVLFPEGKKTCLSDDSIQQLAKLTSNEPYEFTLEIRHKNGTLRSIRHKASLLGERNTPEGNFVTLWAEDITEQLFYQQVKEVNVKGAERLFHYGSWEFRAGDDFVVWTDGLFELLELDVQNYPDYRVPESFYSSFIPEPERTEVVSQARKHLQEGTPYIEIEHSVITATGKLKYVIFRMNTFIVNNAPLVMGMVHDNTQAIEEAKIRHEQVLELQSQHTQMEEAEAIFRFGSWSYHRDEGNFRWSQGMFKLMGLQAEDYPSSVVSLYFYRSFVHPEDAAAVDLYTDNVLRQRRTHYEHTHRMLDANGELKYVMLRASVEYDDSGNLLRAIGVTADLTEIQTYRRQLEKQVEALHKSNQELEQFAYVASHDLQEPLRKIKAFGERLEKKYSPLLEKEGTFFIERMMNASQRMNTLIEDLLMYSRVSKQNEPFQQVDCNEVLANVIDDLEIKILQENAQILIEDKLPVLEAQGVHMQQLFQNLLENALKFRKPNENPIVHIKASLMKPEEVVKIPLLNAKRTYYKFSIQDNGIGFEQLYAERIFTIFQRLHGRAEYEGTGIGLAICKKIVMTHGGYIEAIGEEDRGATVIFYLPITKSE